MPPLPFALHVPADPILRAVAGGVAGRYFELCGGAPGGAAAFAGDVQRAVDEAASAQAASDVSFRSDAAGVDAVVSGGGRTTHLRTTF